MARGGGGGGGGGGVGLLNNPNISLIIDPRDLE